MTDDITRREALRRTALLLGGTLSAPTILGVLAGCDRGASDGAAAWTPRTLSAEHNAAVEAIAEAIIPETDTPGARSARVNRFIDAMLTDYYPAEERERFLSGLARVDARAQATHGKRFAALTPAQQTAIVAELDRLAFTEVAPEQSVAAAGAAGGKAAKGAKAAKDTAATTPDQQSPVAGKGDVATGQGVGADPRAAAGAAAADSLTVDPGDVGPESFFRRMKELTLVGYYTSEPGATRELRVAPFGPYRADVPYAAGTPAWA